MESTPVLIVGGGAAGLAAALETAKRGQRPILIEKSPYLGGQANRFVCKAAPECAQCGACRVNDLLDRVRGSRNIVCRTLAMPVAARPTGEGWEVDIAPQPTTGRNAARPPAYPLTEKTSLLARTVILAVGHTPFNARLKTRFGLGRVPGVVSALDLERSLREGSAGPHRRTAFIQCVGSRDESLGRPWCSRVCCGYALRMARLMRREDPEMEAVFFHMDVQDYGRGWENELAEMRKDIRFVRSIPGEVLDGGEGPQVDYQAEDGSRVREGFDLVVLSVGMGPPLGASALGELFGAELTRDGFLGRDTDPVETGAPGVFVAGAARGPRSLAESMEHAALAAARACLYLDAGKEAAHGQG